jgi:hypothetical protein
VTIAVPGENGAVTEEPVGTGSIMAPPAAEPVAMLDAKTTIDASEAPAIGAVDAIVVEVTGTVTVAASGQETGDREGPTYTGSTEEPVATVAAEDLKD